MYFDNERPTSRPALGGHRDVLVHFMYGETPTRFRIYESMYDRAKEVFYNEDSTFRYIVAFEFVLVTNKDDIDEWVVSPHKTYINLQAICSMKVIGVSHE